MENDCITTLNLNEEMKGKLKQEVKPRRWVVIHVDEAYIHCSKHIPNLQKAEKDIDWGTDDVRKKGGDFFKVKQAAKEDNSI